MSEVLVGVKAAEWVHQKFMVGMNMDHVRQVLVKVMGGEYEVEVSGWKGVDVKVSARTVSVTTVNLDVEVALEGDAARAVQIAFLTLAVADNSSVMGVLNLVRCIRASLNVTVTWKHLLECPEDSIPEELAELEPTCSFIEDMYVWVFTTNEHHTYRLVTTPESRSQPCSCENTNWEPHFGTETHTTPTCGALALGLGL